MGVPVEVDGSRASCCRRVMTWGCERVGRGEGGEDGKGEKDEKKTKEEESDGGEICVIVVASGII